MKLLGQISVGIFSALGSSLLVLAAILLSLTEGGAIAAPVIPTEMINPTTILQPTSDLVITPTITRLLVITATPVPIVICPIPAGWLPYTLESGDTLAALAARHTTSIEQIQKGNCLIGSTLLPGTILYLPPPEPSPTITETATQTATITASFSPAPTDTMQPTSTPCLPPAGWIRYQIQPNDTLLRISRAYGISVNQLMAANCLYSSYIQAGSTLYVPNVPTRTPQPSTTDTPSVPTDTATPELPTPSPTETPTETLPVPPSETPTETPQVAPSEPATETPTDLPLPSETPVSTESTTEPTVSSSTAELPSP